MIVGHIIIILCIIGNLNANLGADNNNYIIIAKTITLKFVHGGTCFELVPF